MTVQPAGPHIEKSEILVIGIGNAFRGDDAAGLLAARELSARSPAGVMIVESRGDGTDIMNAWKGRGKVILIDAMLAGLTPGAIFRFVIPGHDLSPNVFGSSSHTLGAGEAIALAKSLGELPGELVVFGIEGRQFTLGAGMSPEVESQVPKLVRMVEAELELLRSRSAA